jgi:hypothetical protein
MLIKSMPCADPARSQSISGRPMARQAQSSPGPSPRAPSDYSSIRDASLAKHPYSSPAVEPRLEQSSENVAQRTSANEDNAGLLPVTPSIGPGTPSLQIESPSSRGSVHRYSDTIDMGSFGRAVGERHAASSAAEPRRMERQNSSPALGIAFSSAGDEKYGSDMFSAPIWSHAEEAAIHPLDTSQDISDRTILPPSQDTSDRTNLSPSPSFAQLQMTSAPAPGRSGSTDSGVPKAKSKLRTLFSTKGSVVK